MPSLIFKHISKPILITGTFKTLISQYCHLVGLWIYLLQVSTWNVIVNFLHFCRWPKYLLLNFAFLPITQYMRHIVHSFNRGGRVRRRLFSFKQILTNWCFNEFFIYPKHIANKLHAKTFTCQYNVVLTYHWKKFKTNFSEEVLYQRWWKLCFLQPYSKRSYLCSSIT